MFFHIWLISLFLTFCNSCGDYAHLFTKEEYDIIASKPVRKEIRTITEQEWNEVVNAIWEMKHLVTEDGILKYGPTYESWDRFLCRHMTATADPSGDKGHASPVFIIFHRALLLQYEKVLQLIKPNLKIGFPYWNWKFDAYDTDNSIIWSDKYFGSRNGDPDNNHIVTNGRFAYFPVRENDDLLDTHCDIHNSYGFMRCPLVPIKNKYVTRFGGNMCDEFNDVLGNITFFDICHEKPSTVVEWQYCIDQPIHGNIHVKVGGTHRLYEDIEAPDNCWDWELSLGLQDGLSINSFVKAYNCFDFPTCDKSQPVHECQGYLTHKCKAYGTTYDLLDRELTSYVGDFWDVTSSPNDPIFPFHHLNMDRHFSKWQLKNYHLKDTYYGFPTKGYGPGGKLFDVMNEYDPFVNLFNDIDLKNTPLTVKDVFDKTDFLNAPYVYDEILELIDRNNCGFDDNNDTDNEIQDEKVNHFRFSPFMLL